MKLAAVLKESASGTAAMDCGLKGRNCWVLQESIEDQEAADMKKQHGDRICQPILLAALVDAGYAVEDGLDRVQNRRQEGALAGEDPCHVAADRPHQRKHDRAIDQQSESSH